MLYRKVINNSILPVREGWRECTRLVQRERGVEGVHTFGTERERGGGSAHVWYREREGWRECTHLVQRERGVEGVHTFGTERERGGGSAHVWYREREGWRECTRLVQRERERERELRHKLTLLRNVIFQDCSLGSFRPVKQLVLPKAKLLLVKRNNKDRQSNH